MCGIAAVFSKQTSNIVEPHLDRLLIEMLGHIRHRGDTCRFAERLNLGDAAMGTNRLAIVDREHAQQPVKDPDTGLTIVMNGEIYNHGQLREELRSLGHTFASEGDAEVALQAYQCWGPESVKRLDGIFGFVIYDPMTKAVFAARDHIGIKPLYLASFEHTFAFASEKKCFLGHGGDVTELRPGHYWFGGKQHVYHSFKADPKRRSEAEAISICRDLLDDAVRRQVATDLPIAVVFSGGLDSTIILHLATKYHGDVTAFSLGTDTSPDLVFAKRFCKERGIPHRVIPFHVDRIPRTIPKAIFDGEFFEPVDISDMVSMSTIFAAIGSEGFKIALSGDGSDEIFAGYDMFKTEADPYALTTYRVNNLHLADLQRVDRSSMINAVECRVPLLDKQLMDFALSLPIDLKIRGDVEKYVLREAFRDALPDYMVDRPKIRMPEGIGIQDDVFQELGRLDPIGSNGLLEGVLLDSDQVANALSRYLAFGFPQPPKRVKRAGLDYHQGGYFAFSEPAIMRENKI